MLARIRKAQEENEGGFTLIELLVVIIIIGILAAIAIPVFLNQRKKGYDAGAKADVRNLATLEETYLTDNGSYTSVIASMTDYQKTAGVHVALRVATDGQSFCVLGYNDKTGTAPTVGNTVTVASGGAKAFFYDSTGGGASATQCSSAAPGVVGGSWSAFN